MSFSKVTHCKSCRAPIVWCRTWNGRRMPLDAVPTDDGDFVAGEEGTVVRVPPGALVADSVARYTSHFVTCPERAEWRRPRERQRS